VQREGLAGLAIGRLGGIIPVKRDGIWDRGQVLELQTDRHIQDVVEKFSLSLGER